MESRNDNIKVAIQGLGFVGAAMSVAVSSQLDRLGKPKFKVFGVDLPNKEGQNRIDSINSGIFPFQTEDKYLEIELKKAIRRGNLLASSKKSVFAKANVILVSINCDLKKSDSQEYIDLKNFKRSIQELSEEISEGTLLIIESTVPPGTCEKIIYPIIKDAFIRREMDIEKFYLAHSYERVMPGSNYLSSIINYWRVYSGINQKSADKCEQFLSEIINIEEYPLTRLKNTTSSEVGKLLENSYRAVNIAFMEEWGRFAEDSGVDLFEVIEAIRLRPTHSNIRQPGFGVGGYCLTKDPLFAKIAARDILCIKGHKFPFSTEAVRVNAKMPLVSLEKIKTYFNGNLKNINILLMGVTYRQNVGDTRFSPSEKFVNMVLREDARVSAFDPLVSSWNEVDIIMEPVLPKLKGFHVIVFAVPHNEFKKIDLKSWASDLDVLFFDANNVLTKKQVSQLEKNSMNFMSIGRG